MMLARRNLSHAAHFAQYQYVYLPAGLYLSHHIIDERCI